MKLMSRPKPLALPDLDGPELAAIKCVAKGEATDEQQRMAFDTIVKKLGGLDVLSMQDDERWTAFCDGKKFVSFALLHIAAQPMDKLLTKKEIKQ